LQDLAHTTVGAPAADHGKVTDHGKPPTTTTKTAVGPDATGHAAFGLRTAWEQLVTRMMHPTDRPAAWPDLGKRV
jgi:hypothetical protein